MMRALPVLLSVHAASCAAATAGQPPVPPQRIAFHTYEVVTGSAERQTVLTGFLLDGRVADLAVLSVDAEDRRRLHSPSLSIQRRSVSTLTPTSKVRSGMLGQQRRPEVLVQRI